MKREAPFVYFASSASYGMSGPRSFTHAAANSTAMIPRMMKVHFNMRSPLVSAYLGIVASVFIADADTESGRLPGLRHLGAGQKESRETRRRGFETAVGRRRMQVRPADWGWHSADR